MLLPEYLQDFVRIIDDYSKTGFIVTSEVRMDIRTEKIGVIKSAITFIDDSKLFTTEYIDLRYKTEKISYSFHFQEKNGNLIFRYDNASHKPDLGFKNHKHVKGIALQSDVPELRAILEEIISNFLRTK
jgi:hypothetical protein